MNDSSPSAYAFGPFVIDSGRRILLCDGQQISLPLKVFDTLLTLVENRDRVVTKDELLKAVWGATVVEEGGLARNVSLLRKALGEKPDDHQYVVTLPGRGYQFVAEVRPLFHSVEAFALATPPAIPSAPAATDPLLKEIDGPKASAPPSRRVFGRRWLTLGTIATLTLASRRILETLRARSRGWPVPFAVAGAYAVLGEKDEAFELLFRNLETRDTWAAYTMTDPSLVDLHSDPRWSVLLRRLNFPVGGGDTAAVGHATR
jgi:DNA-binding winged helix-turn-helix (wHTH) protein